MSKRGTPHDQMRIERDKWKIRADSAEQRIEAVREWTLKYLNEQSPKPVRGPDATDLAELWVLLDESVSSEEG